MDEVLAGTGEDIPVKVCRERVQRWLANQRNARWVIDALKVLLPDGTPAFVEWARRMIKRSATDVPRDASTDVTEMLLMPEIIAALHFEMEMGNYFEATSAWHGMPGSDETRPGFRCMELPWLWLELIAPWWESTLHHLTGLLPARKG